MNCVNMSKTGRNWHWLNQDWFGNVPFSLWPICIAS